MTQQVRSSIFDRNGPNGADKQLVVREGGAAIITAAQAKQLDGEAYVASVYHGAVGIAAAVDFRIMSAATRKLIFNIEAQSNRIRMQIFQAGNVTVGTLLTAAPPDMGVNLSANFIWLAPTVTTTGTIRFDGMAGNIGDYIFTAQAGVTYLMRLTNNSGATNVISTAVQTFV